MFEMAPSVVIIMKRAILYKQYVSKKSRALDSAPAGTRQSWKQTVCSRGGTMAIVLTATPERALTGTSLAICATMCYYYDVLPLLSHLYLSCNLFRSQIFLFLFLLKFSLTFVPSRIYFKIFYAVLSRSL